MIEVIDIGLVDYKEGVAFMREVHSGAVKRGDKNYLILCQHYDVYTVGKHESKVFPVRTIRTDRGGSVIFHTPGQQIFYFVFKVKSPMSFYRKVVNSFYRPLKSLNPQIEYIHRIPGFYVGNRKLGFLGFRYKDGYSLHGVAINYDVDLEKFNKISPCGLEGYQTTSLIREDVKINLEELKRLLVESVSASFR
ncbi:MAG: lipoyl(octanoyl) transferase LipB [Hydrogenothermaceae bacterium]|nr:lipoyl(octanoyl) transferase LipB [Hydrogenothermaceae bacterium]